MRVLFKTNIDNYQTNCFPENLPFVPRIGEKVMVTNVFVQWFKNKKLPIRLEVFDVIYSDQGVVCELWYNKTDLKIAKQAGANVL